MSIDKKLMEKIMKDVGGATARNIHSEALQTHSPALNFLFGNGWGIPKSYSLLLYGNPGGGKSLICRSFIGTLHKSDPDAVAVVFDTEFRWEAQVLSDPATQMVPYDIDEKRLIVIAENDPSKVFDVIQFKIPMWKQAGMKIELVVIDSITNIQGRRAMDQKTILTQQRGDWALTIQEGLKAIQPIIRKNQIGLILTTQIRDEQDPQEQMKKKKIKPAAGWAAKHFSEYCMYVEGIDSQAGRATLADPKIKLEDTAMSVFKPAKEGERTGHRIRARMIRASMGPKNRVAEFTVDYRNGIIHTHEEVWALGCGTGAVERPTVQSYTFGDREWRGKPSFMEALKTEPDLCAKILEEVHRRDLAGAFKGLSEGLEGSDEDVAAEESEES